MFLFATAPPLYFYNASIAYINRKVKRFTLFRRNTFQKKPHIYKYSQKRLRTRIYATKNASAWRIHATKTPPHNVKMLCIMRYRAFLESRDTEHFRFYYNKSTFAKVTLQIFYNNSFSPKQRRALFNKFTFAEVTPRTFLINSLLTKQRRALF